MVTIQLISSRKSSGEVFNTELCTDLKMRRLMCIELNSLLVHPGFLGVRLLECGAVKGTTRM